MFAQAKGIFQFRQLYRYKTFNTCADWRCYFIVVFTINIDMGSSENKNVYINSCRPPHTPQTHARIDCKVQNATAVEWTSNKDGHLAISHSFIATFSASNIIYLLKYLPQNIRGEFGNCRWIAALPDPKPNDKHVPVELVDPSKAVLRESIALSGMTLHPTIMGKSINRKWKSHRIHSLRLRRCEKRWLLSHEQTWKSSAAIDSTVVTSFYNFGIRSAVNATWLAFYCLFFSCIRRGNINKMFDVFRDLNWGSVPSDGLKKTENFAWSHNRENFFPKMTGGREGMNGVEVVFESLIHPPVLTKAVHRRG